jgi:endogenous inhibitor of DNA gyrase (YacG/DUF329 family)
MIQGKCPTCGKRFEVESLDKWPSFPFCSDRCKLIDLGRWIDGDYVIPGPPVEKKPAAGAEDEDD